MPLDRLVRQLVALQERDGQGPPVGLFLVQSIRRSLRTSGGSGPICAPVGGRVCRVTLQWRGTRWRIGLGRG